MVAGVASCRLHAARWATKEFLRDIEMQQFRLLIIHLDILWWSSYNWSMGDHKRERHNGSLRIN
jgi:hypothetical protein